MSDIPSAVVPWLNIGGILSLFYIVWQVSKRIATQDANQKILEKQLSKALDELKEKHNEDVKQMHTQYSEDIKNVYIRMEEMRTERKEEIAKGIGNNYDKFDGLQKQIDSVKSDVKDQSSRMNVVDTKVKGHDDLIKSNNDRTNENFKFQTNWNQRIEDRVVEAENRAMKIIEDTKRELMGTMNILINLSNIRRTNSR